MTSDALPITPPAPAARTIVKLVDATKEMLWSALEKGRDEQHTKAAGIAHQTLVRLCGRRNENGFDPPRGFLDTEAVRDIRFVLGALARNSAGFDQETGQSYVQKYHEFSGPIRAGLELNNVASQSTINALQEIEWACSEAKIRLTPKPLVIHLSPATNDLLHRAAAVSARLAPGSPATGLMLVNIDQLCGPWNPAGHFDPPMGFTTNPSLIIKHIIGSLAHQLGKGETSGASAQRRDQYPLYNNSLRDGLRTIQASDDEMLRAIADIEQKCAAAKVSLARRTAEHPGR